MSRSGPVYASYDDVLLKLSDTVEDALVALCEVTEIVGID